MKLLTMQSGYSLVETIIAIGILMLAVVAPMTIAVKSIQSSQYVLEQNTATFLAQEPISIIEAMRDQAALIEFSKSGTHDFWAWTDLLPASCTDGSGCNFDARNPNNLNVSDIKDCAVAEDCRLYYADTDERSAYRTDNSLGGIASPYIRKLYIQKDDTYSIHLTSVVEWQSNFLGQTQSVTLTSSLYNLYEGF